MNNYLLLALCDKSSIVEIMLIVKTLFKITCYMAPLLVIIISIIHIFKTVLNGKDDDLKDALKVTVKRVIAGLLIAFLPALINYVFTSLIKGNEVDFIACFESASKEKVESLRAKEEAEEEAKKKVQEKEDEAQLKKAWQEEQKQKGAKKQSFEEWKKKKEEEERRQRELEQQRMQQQSGGGSPGSVPASVPAGTANIIIGDSRTVGMCASITGDWTHCQFSNGGKSNGVDFYIAQSSMGYTWFNNTAVPAVNKIIRDNPGVRYNIYSLMGVNYLLGDIDKYIPTYNSLANGEWKDQKIILVSVTPVNEEIERQHGYGTKNANIETFNTKLKNGVSASNVAYCDVYNQLGSNFGTGDGLHYTGNTYKQIYNLMKQC